MRTVITLPDEQARRLDEVCRRAGISRAEGVRRAVSRYLAERSPRPEEGVFGIWRARRVDGLAYERRLPGEWT